MLHSLWASDLATLMLVEVLDWRRIGQEGILKAAIDFRSFVSLGQRIQVLSVDFSQLVSEAREIVIHRI